MTTSESVSIQWPDPSTCSYQYRGQGRNRPRYMHTPEGSFPGVTTLLNPWDKEALVKWAANVERDSCLEAAGSVFEKIQDLGYMPDPDWCRGAMDAELGPARSHQKLKEKAADIGSHAHAYCQWWIGQQIGIEAKEPKIPDESMIAAMSFQDWWKQAGLTAVRIEQPVWNIHAEVHYAGTIDYIVQDAAGRLGVLDLKTSKGIYPSMHLQVAAYLKAAQRWGSVEWASLVRIPKNIEGDLRVEVQELGNLTRWNGNGMEPAPRSVDDLFAAFQGIARAWSVLLEPAP